jgi:hypothetical protein
MVYLYDDIRQSLIFDADHDITLRKLYLVRMWVKIVAGRGLQENWHFLIQIDFNQSLQKCIDYT